MMMSSPINTNTFILITLIINLIFINGQHVSNTKCDENLVNMHMLECYKKHIDNKIDTSSVENAYFMEGSNLCQAYNQSSPYRKCLFSIFGRNEICSYERYQYSYQYFKIYWKLILTSCLIENNEQCSPSHLSEKIINKCHYSFDERFPTKCKDFLRSMKCLERHEHDLIPSTFGTKCSRNQGFYYFFGDLAARLQLSINICEKN
ncbi:hypothetical protein I4U23_004808 [Adineta vaga]|nr:hypothetical protein I4U23_004808 [Adineta vaga]